MALLPADLLQPAGALTADLFPASGVVVADYLQAYLDDGYAQASGIAATVDQDKAARYWAYARAYDYRHQRAIDEAAAKALDGQGSASHTDAQIQAWADKAAAARTLFQRLCRAATGPAAPRVAQYGTMTVPVKYRW